MGRQRNVRFRADVPGLIVAERARVPDEQIEGLGRILAVSERDSGDNPPQPALNVEMGHDFEGNGAGPASWWSTST